MRSELLNALFTPVTRIKGVGPNMGVAMQRLLPRATLIDGSDIPIIRDLLFHLPIALVDRSFTCPLYEFPGDRVATFIVTAEEHFPPPRTKRKIPYKILCANETGTITLIYFNAYGDYLKRQLPVGEPRVISGKVEWFEGKLQMPHPDIIAPVSKLAEVQKPEAVYPLTADLSNKRLRSFIQDALKTAPDLPEWIAEETLTRHSWPRWKAALTAAHSPLSQDDIAPTHPARERLAYDEILANQLNLARRRQRAQKQAGRVVPPSNTLVNSLISQLPFALTGGQKEAFAQIAQDMASGHRMTRLLQGDVGSGKTVVALLAMVQVAEAGFQSALMAPTEMVARQHFEVISTLVTSLGLDVVLLTGSVKGKERAQRLEAIASGKASIIIGTHALFQEHVQFSTLALAIIDEQHRFGVNQRMALSAKGEHPHLLHMSATPIPRTLTMTVYGDMDVSMLREKPAEREPITTRVIPLSRYAEMMDRLQAALDRGEKVYWICPLIEDDHTGHPERGISRVEGSHAMDGDSSTEFTPYLLRGLGMTIQNDIAAAETRYTEFKARFGDRVGLVHGRMKADERALQMQTFASGATKLLVATTVVEVGVDIRDATIMVIEKAERFGLSQLHQLRGRVGRGNQASSCVLLYSDRHPERGIGRVEGSHATEGDSSTSLGMTENSYKRLSILRETEDGFKIAEADLNIRGSGDLLGARQSGMPRFVFTDLYAHQALITEARDQAISILRHDPSLSSISLQLLMQLFGYEVD